MSKSQLGKFTVADHFKAQSDKRLFIKVRSNQNFSCKCKTFDGQFTIVDRSNPLIIIR